MVIKAAPAVVHYAALCTTGKLEFMLQICQSAVAAYNGVTETSPLPRTSPFCSSTQYIFFKSISSSTKGELRAEPQ